MPKTAPPARPTSLLNFFADEGVLRGCGVERRSARKTKRLMKFWIEAARRERRRRTKRAEE